MLKALVKCAERWDIVSKFEKEKNGGELSRCFKSEKLEGEDVCV